MVKNGKKLNLIMHIVMLGVTCLLLVMTMFGWYVSNKQVSAKGIVAATATNNKAHYKSIQATQFSLTGDVTENTYTIDGSNITLSVSDVYTRTRFKASEFKTDGTYYTGVKNATTEEYAFTQVTSGTYDSSALYFTYASVDVSALSDSEKTFNFYGMLPGEYVDIKVTYAFDDSMDGTNYKFQLNEVTGGKFVVDTIPHYATGAFKYKTLSLSAKTGTPEFTADSDFTFFQVYDINKGDSEYVTKTLLSDAWDKSYEELTIKFRVMEDFTQFYDLLSKASNTYGNLLNQKTFTIGKLFIEF